MTPHQLLDASLRTMEEQTRSALYDAARFECCIVVAAMHLKAAESPEKVKEIPADQMEEVLRGRNLTNLGLDDAIKNVAGDRFVVEGLQGEFPNLVETLNKGRETRNRIIHDAAHLMMSGRYMTDLAKVLVPSDFWPTKAMPPFVTILEMRNEIAGPLRLSVRIHGLAFRKAMAAINPGLHIPPLNGEAGKAE